jgi:molybdenum-dependent DNA-binding transcriptional regulator ModE
MIIIDKEILDELSKLLGGGQFAIVAKGSPRRGAFRRGVSTLLEGVIELGSMDKASKSLYMGDSTARRVLVETERTLGFKLVETAGSQGSRLTPEGEVLLKIYHQTDLEVKVFAAMRFKEIVSKGGIQEPEGYLGRVLFGFYGNLPAVLLREIEDTSSMRETAKKMRVTSKRLMEMIKEIEAKIGYPIVNHDRKRIITLTDEGKKHLEFLESMEKSVVDYGNWGGYGKGH